MNSCNEHDELKFNPFVEIAQSESEETLQKIELFAPLPDENSRYKYLESCASEAVT